MNMNTILEVATFTSDALTRREIQKQEIADSQEREELDVWIDRRRYNQERESARNYTSGDSAFTYRPDEYDQRYKRLCDVRDEQTRRDDTIRRTRQYWFVTYYNKQDTELGFLCFGLREAQDAVLRGVEMDYIQPDGTLYVGVAGEEEVAAWQNVMRHMWWDCINAPHMAQPIAKMFPDELETDDAYVLVKDVEIGEANMLAHGLQTALMR